MYFCLSDFSCVLFILYRYLVSQCSSSLWYWIHSDSRWLFRNRLPPYQFSQIFPIAFGVCKLQPCTDSSRQDCGFSTAIVLAQTGSFIDRRSLDRETISTKLLPFVVTSPSSEGLSTMRHSFRLNAHAISRSFITNCRNRDIIIFSFNGSNERKSILPSS